LDSAIDDQILLLDTSLISVWVYPRRQMIHHHMKQFCFGDDFRAALLKGVEAMEQHQATKWLSDDRANGAIVPEDAAWAVEHWFPRARAAGWKHWAVVQPLKIIGQINMERFSKDYGRQGVNARLFSDPDAAMRWLDAQ